MDGPFTLSSLIEGLRTRAQDGESQDSLIEWLYRLTSGLHIRMRYDEFTPVEPPSKKPPAPQPVGLTNHVDTTTAPEATAPEATAPLGTPPIPLPKAPPAPKKSIPGGLPKSNANRGRPQTKSRGRQTSGKQARSVPVSLNRGQLVVLFTDSALQERTPPEGGRFGHLADCDAYVGRVILSCDWRNSQSNAPLCAECNGAVIDARSWTPLVIPPRAFAPRPTSKSVNTFLSVPDKDGKIRTGLYDIIQVSDGTVVTLYSWTHPSKGNIWCLASSNGYDVSHLKWMGDKTYAELIFCLLSEYPKFVEATGLGLVRNYLCENDVRLTFRTLDPRRSFTIGFRHPNFHPMGADPAGVWNIQSTDLSKGVPEYLGGLPHIPRQALYTREDIIKLAALAGRQGVGSDNSGLQHADLLHILRSSLDDAKSAIAGKSTLAPLLSENSLERGIHRCKFNYGFILRSRSPKETGAHSDILCESPLLQRIRQFIYRRIPRQIRDELDERTRMEYNSLRAFLTPTDKDEFIAIFPEFKPRYIVYQEFVDNVINLIIHAHRQTALSPTKTEDKTLEIQRTRTKTVANGILRHILQHEKNFKVFDKAARSIVHDYVVRPEYAVLYLRAIGLPARP